MKKEKSEQKGCLSLVAMSLVAKSIQSLIIGNGEYKMNLFKQLLKDRETSNNIIDKNKYTEAPLMEYILAYKSKSRMHLIREHMVSYALKYGNKKAAKKFDCHRNTISKWKNRYLLNGIKGLKDYSRDPKYIPHKIIDTALIDKICKLRKKTGYGAEFLEKQFDLPVSHNAIHRILKENGKIKPKKKKHQKKIDLWQIKKQLKAIETKWQLDAKLLTDIPHYFRQYNKLGLLTQMAVYSKRHKIWLNICILYGELVTI